MAYFLFFHARTQLTLLTHVLHAKIFDAADKGCTTATDTANEELRVANISVAQRQVATELNAILEVGVKCTLRRYPPLDIVDRWR